MRVESGFVFKYRSKDKKGFARWKGFQYYGKTKRGVSKWVGSWDQPPLWFIWMFMGWGAIVGSAGLIALFLRLLNLASHPGLMPVIMVGLIHGAVFCGVGWALLKLRRRIEGLTPQDAVCERLQVDEARLQQIADEKGIKPKININGLDFYDLNDFSQARMLLRASAVPTAQPDTLLRPATAHLPQSTSEQLLRPTDNTGAAPDQRRFTTDATEVESESEVNLDPYLSQTSGEQINVVGNAQTKE